MGVGQSKKKVGYQELRESIPGSMVPDQDFDLLYKLCKVESAGAITTLLHPSPSQMFFVVVSGEVSVQLTSPALKALKADHVTAVTYTRGEVIHFFNAAIRMPGTIDFDFGECLHSGEVKMALHFKHISAAKAVSRVIGIDKKGVAELLLQSKSNLKQFCSFVDMNFVKIAQKSPYFKTITHEQVRLSFVSLL
jgi:hypothetical protein